MGDTARHGRRRNDWVAAGILLVIAAIIPLAVMPGSPVSEVLRRAGDAAFAAAMLLFAFGPSSVVARRPLGVAALIVLAASPFADLLWVIPLQSPGDIPLWLPTATTALSVVVLAAGIVAAVQTARAGVVPPALRWVPLIALLIAASPGVFMAVLGVAAVDGVLAIAQYAGGILPLLSFVAVAGLGIVAIVAGWMPQASAPRGVQVYPPVTD